ncbi:putative F-box/LRR-repeat protein 23 [Iris pallida]|uniref:F-box/LRR-repeat protein 23 n=1 Tax=Iris pallida TaxID=29817 RepID=A0AAX6HIC5_IRIPA|nr:putative F-box/LRR-repeat protein 23 [Iris pallida]
MENPNPNPEKQPKSSSSSSSCSRGVDAAAIESSSREEECWRNWAELGQDALSLIFEKAGAVDVLMGAQFVCRSWRSVSLDPSLWRLIHIVDDNRDISWNVDIEQMAMEAINRAQGLVQCFSAGVFATDTLLAYLADRNSNLRCLRLIPTYELSCEGLAEVVGGFPLLEELEITFPSYNTQHVFKLLGEACPHLKCFRYNQQGSRNKYGQNDEHAFGIANYMPELRQLQIVGNMLTNKGLLAILDKCLHLESLDLRRCFHVNLNASVLAKCARIENLRCPDDATKDCGFIDEFEDDFSDDDTYLPHEDTDLDMYDDYFHEDYYDYSEDDYEDYTDYSYLVKLASNLTL